MTVQLDIYISTLFTKNWKKPWIALTKTASTGMDIFPTLSRCISVARLFQFTYDGNVFMLAKHLLHSQIAFLFSELCMMWWNVNSCESQLYNLRSTPSYVYIEGSECIPPPPPFFLLSFLSLSLRLLAEHVTGLQLDWALPPPTLPPLSPSLSVSLVYSQWRDFSSTVGPHAEPMAGSSPGPQPRHASGLRGFEGGRTRGECRGEDLARSREQSVPIENVNLREGFYGWSSRWQSQESQ